MGMKRTVSAKSNGRSNARQRPGPRHRRKQASFVACVRNDGYEASFEIGKVYVVLPAPQAAKYGRTRVMDESDEDYLSPVEYFLPVQLSKSAVEAFTEA